MALSCSAGDDSAPSLPYSSATARACAPLHVTEVPEPVSPTDGGMTANCIILVRKPNNENNVKCRRSVVEKLGHNGLHAHERENNGEKRRSGKRYLRIGLDHVQQFHCKREKAKCVTSGRRRVLNAASVVRLETESTLCIPLPLPSLNRKLTHSNEYHIIKAFKNTTTLLQDRFK